MGTPAEKTKPIVPKDLPKPKAGTTFNFKSVYSSCLKLSINFYLFILYNPINSAVDILFV